MSTRCQIGFFETMPSDEKMIEELRKSIKPTAVALIYRHSDGYPNSVLPDLDCYLAKCQRNDDPCYAAAWFVHFLIDRAMRNARKWAKLGNRKADAHNYLGHGIDNEYHGDIQYFYAVAGGKVKAFALCNGWNRFNP